MFPGIIAAAVIVALFIVISIAFRTVVSTNDVHIVQSTRKTVSYGKDQPAGNTYYAWPSWVPIIGVRTTRLPMSVFSETLDGYAAYDKDRLPFMVDIIAFFRIVDSNTAAQRVASFHELTQQLQGVLQGAIRSILASNALNDILEGRSQFGEAFTKEVDAQLKEWGVHNVKTIELMDIRDAQGSQVIANIMAKKKSEIEKESRIAVAGNLQAAKTAEIEANQTVLVREQEASQAVGIRTAEAQREVQISQQQAQQQVKEQERATAEKAMAVLQVQTVRKAEIEKQANIVVAEQNKATAVIDAEAEKSVAITVAEGTKQQTIIAAEGNRQQVILAAEAGLEAAKKNAEGTQAIGLAVAAAETAKNLAPVTAQVTLAKEIGSNEGYQTYLVSIRQIEAAQAVGVEQAKALNQAEIKVIATAGDAGSGLSSARDVFSVKGGQMIGAALESLKNTGTGKEVIDALTGTKPNGQGAHK